MAEVFLALGVVSSIITCIEMSGKVTHRLEYYLARTKNPPRIFVTLNEQLPLLIQTFKQIKRACDEDAIDLESQKALVRTVEGCIRLTGLLESYLDDCLPAEGDSFSQKAKKVVKSIRSEKAIRDVQNTLEAYKSTLTLYCSHLSTMSPGESVADAKEHPKYYEVPTMAVHHFVGRNNLLEAIGSCLRNDDGPYTRSRICVLFGMGGESCFIDHSQGIDKS